MDIIFFIGIITIFLFRNYVFVAIVHAMLIALLCKHFTYKKIWIILVSYSSFVALFFLSGFLNSFLNIPAAIIKRKAEFASLGEGNTNLLMNELQPTFKSFVFNLPQAINHFFFRPYLLEFINPAILLTALELFIYQLIILLFIFFRKKHLIITNNFNVFGVILFINMMLIIGYTIPNIGAIVRYRSVFWIFILCPMVCTINFKKMNFLKKQTA